MKKLTKIIVGGIIVISLILASVVIYINYSTLGWDSYPAHFVMYCEKDSANKTLRVTDVEKPSYYKWNEIEVIMGNATLPIGTINTGDLITNCSGVVKLVYNPSATLLGEWNFEE
jgi:hypothetical protein